MIRELSELGKRIREVEKDNRIVHDALKQEPVSIELIIDEDGSFKGFITFEKKMTTCEAITAKKGKARLLLDKAEEVFEYIDNKHIEKLKSEKDSEKKIAAYIATVKNKHALYLSKIKEYQNIDELKPVLYFFEKNRKKGFEKTVKAFEEQVSEKERGGNIAFRLNEKDIRLHEEQTIIKAIVEKYEKENRDKLTESARICSICGKKDFPVEDIPHGMIKKVPDGQSSGCALVSYNEDAFESYGLDGNNNSSICINCSRTYVEGLNWLMINGGDIIDKKGKEHYRYTNRKNFGSDTAMVYWTRENSALDEMDLLEEPDVQEIEHLIESVTSGEPKKSKSVSPDQFYSCTLSGAAARIAVRDWIEMSLIDYKKSISEWFKDICISNYNFEQKKQETYYPPIYILAKSSQNDKEDKKTTLSRVAAHLWSSALKRSPPPLWILSSVLKRARLSNNGITPERASLIRLILNRNHKGGIMIKERLDKENDSTAYMCGRIFAVLESVQRAALGKDINAGIRERFFSFASTNPAPAFGRLMKLSQNHLSKLKGEKPGLAVNLDKELTELFSKISEFPVLLSLEEQGQFAIGYYHQKQAQFQKPELKEITEEEENE